MEKDPDCADQTREEESQPSINETMMDGTDSTAEDASFKGIPLAPPAEMGMGTTFPIEGNAKPSNDIFASEECPFFKEF